MMLTDLIPIVEKTYRVLPGRENRAMAGLPMGGMQTFPTTLVNLDKFAAYIGGFSESCGRQRSGIRSEDFLQRGVCGSVCLQQKNQAPVSGNRLR